jgi:hypothetical protein
MTDHANELTLPLVALAQCLFYVPTGLWAILGPKSFQAVTGPKTDVWLVKTVGALASVIGMALGLAGIRRRTTPEMAILGAGSAAAFSAVDVVYVARGRISRVYLLDAIAECLLLVAWAVLGTKRSGPRG